MNPSNFLKYFYTLLLCLTCLSSLSAQEPAASIPTGTKMLTIGDPKNQPDEQGFGGVSTVYQIGAYEWTVQDWATMLNAVASKPDSVKGISDPHTLWNSAMTPWIVRSGSTKAGYIYKVVNGSEKLPITNVNLYDCARACNYMQNRSRLPLALGQSMDSITEHGA